MARLTAKQIVKVLRMECDGFDYGWFVGCKDRSLNREYINYENGKTVAKEYPAEWLPKEVVKFINDADNYWKIVNEDEWGGHSYVHYEMKREAK